MWWELGCFWDLLLMLRGWVGLDFGVGCFAGLRYRFTVGGLVCLGWVVVVWGDCFACGWVVLFFVCFGLRWLGVWVWVLLGLCLVGWFGCSGWGFELFGVLVSGGWGVCVGWVSLFVGCGFWAMECWFW